MTEPAQKISLNQMVEEMSGTIRTTTRNGQEQIRKGKLRQAELDFHLRRQEAIWHVLTFFRDNEDVLRGFMRMAPGDRVFIVSHGPLVVDLARQLAAKEEIAKAGGPVR